MGKHPTSGQPLEGWSKVGDGTEGMKESIPLGVPLQVKTRESEEKEGGRNTGQEGGIVEAGEEEEPEDWGLWMDQGRDQEDEELQGEGFLGFDDP